MFVMFLLAALPLFGPLSAGVDPPGSSISAFASASAAPRPGCPDLRPRIADQMPPVRRGIADPTDTVRPRTLDELPPGRLELAVHREVDGCAIPAVLREGIGGAPEPERRR